MELVAVFSLLGFCSFIARYSELRIESSFFVVISSVISLLYFFALSGYLKFGADALLISGTALFLASPVYWWNQREQIFQKLITPGFVVTLILLVFLGYFALHSYFSQWDEFSHWGPHAKLIFANHGLLSSSVVTEHKAYPPGGELFYYLFFRLSGYSEPVAYLAQLILTLAPLSVLSNNIPWQKWGRVCLMLCLTPLILGLCFHFRFGPTNILYKDWLVGIYFGMSMVFYFYSGRRTKDILCLTPMIFALSLFKVKLLPLVLVATGVIGADILLNHYYLAVKPQNSVGRKLISTALLPVTSLIAILTWSQYLQLTGVGSEWAMQWNLNSVFHAFLADATSREKSVLINFMYALKWPGIFSAVVSSVVVLICYFTKDKFTRVSVITRHFLMFLGLMGYLAGLLLLYLYVFTDYEAINLASYDRYLNIYLIGWMLVLISDAQTLLRIKTLFSPRYVSNAIGVAVCSIFLVSSYLTYERASRPYSHQQSVHNFQQDLHQISDMVNRLTPPNSKIYNVWQNTTGLPNRILNYQLTPHATNSGCPSLGKSYAKNDVWTCHDSLQQFSQRIKGYDYLLIANVDDNFIQHYGSLLKNKKRLMTYQVCKSQGFNPDYTDPRCEKIKKNVYLFKIEHQPGKLMLVNVLNPRNQARRG